MHPPTRSQKNSILIRSIFHKENISEIIQNVIAILIVVRRKYTPSKCPENIVQQGRVGTHAIGSDVTGDLKQPLEDGSTTLDHATNQSITLIEEISFAKIRMQKQKEIPTCHLAYVD